MRAVCVDERWRVAVDDVPDPAIEQPGDALVRVTAASICGSDLRVPPRGAGHRPGHELVGTVVATGPAVTRWSAGDRVVGACLLGCGACPACTGNDPLGCHDDAWRVYGERGDLPGCQADLVRVPLADAHLADPGDLDDDVAVLLSDSLPTAWLGTQAAGIRPGGDVLVVGLGPVGLAAVWCAHRLGAGRVLAVDPNPVRAAVGERLGATLLDPAAPLPALVDEQTGGRGVPSVVEAVGEPGPVADAVTAAAARGTVVLLGMSVAPAIPVPVRRIGARSLTVRGMVCAPTTAWPALVPLVRAGPGDLGAIVSHHLPLAEAPAAYDLLRRPGSPVVKAALVP